MAVHPEIFNRSLIRPLPEPDYSRTWGDVRSIGHSEVRRVRAVEHIARMRGGAQSHLMRCSDGSYYVVKFQNNPQHRRVLVNELLGTTLATHLGLPTTPIAIVDVCEELIKLTPDLCVEMSHLRIPCQPGLQFGSRYLAEPEQNTLRDILPDEVLLTVENINEFVGMLVFDKWTCNTDSRQVIFNRPDATANYQAWMIDQGFCFNAGEWNFPDAPRRSLYLIPKVYEQVRGIEFFEPWLDALESEIGAQVLLDIAKTIPPEWYEFDSAALQRLLERLDLRKLRVRELIFSARKSSPQIFPNWVDCFHLGSTCHNATEEEKNDVAQNHSKATTMFCSEHIDVRE